LAARAFLVDRGFAAPTLAGMGFSKGGAAALCAADRTFLPGQEQRFAAVVAFYPTCNTRPRAPKPASTVYLPLAEKDDDAGVPPCEALATAYGQAGGKVSVKVYADPALMADMRKTCVTERRLGCGPTRARRKQRPAT
jgi:dienelactone hydrolase